MKVIIVEPFKKPYVADINNDLESMQKIVDGLIQMVFLEDEIVAIVNEEGRIRHLPLNRVIIDSNEQIIDIIAGTFFICSAPLGKDDFESLDNDDIMRYMDWFSRPNTYSPF